MNRSRAIDGGRGMKIAIPPAVATDASPRAIAAFDSGTASVPSYSRSREGRPVVGTAATRPSGGYRPPDWGWDYSWGYYPWGFGFWSYYCDPFWYYDPLWSWGANYVDYGGYVGYGGGTAYVATNVGHVKIKIDPNEAQVYVDGYFVGVVDEFNGWLQRLSLPEGPHRIEVRAAGFGTLTFDVRVLVGHTLTLRGTLQRQP